MDPVFTWLMLSAQTQSELMDRLYNMSKMTLNLKIAHRYTHGSGHSNHIP